MKIRKEYLFYNLLSIIIIVTGFLCKDNFNLITWLIIIETLLIVLFIKKNNSLISVGVIFIILTVLFHCGESFIVTFGINNPYYHRTVIAESIGYEFIDSELYVLVSMFFWGNGYFIWSNKNRYKVVKNTNIDEEFALNYIKKIAIIILAISIIPLLYIDIIKLITLKNGGYMQTYDVYKTGFVKYINLIARFARPAILLLIFSYKNKPKNSRLVLIISSIYFIIMMFSGDRGTNIIYMIGNLFIYYKYVQKVKLKTIIIYIVLGYLLLGIISSISMFRYSELSLNSFIKVFNFRSSDGIIYSCLREFGGTMRTLVYAMRFIPEYRNYNYGLTYFISFLNIFPKLSTSFANRFIDSFGYIYAFPAKFQYSLGGSYLGELYFNFGWIGSILTFFIGLFIGKIDYIIEETIVTKNWTKTAIIISFIPNIILWVRDFFSGIVFVGFWMMIILKFFYKNNNKIAYNNLKQEEIDKNENLFCFRNVKI